MLVNLTEQNISVFIGDVSIGMDFKNAKKLSRRLQALA